MTDNDKEYVSTFRYEYVHLLGLSEEDFGEFRKMFPDKSDKEIERIIIEAVMKAMDRVR